MAAWWVDWKVSQQVAPKAASKETEKAASKETEKAASKETEKAVSKETEKAASKETEKAGLMAAVSGCTKAAQRVGYLEHSLAGWMGAH
jgi:hypothetical protein